MFNTLLVQPLFNLLAVIYAYIPFHDFGLAIIIFTILVRLALWPIVTKQLHSQKAIQELQPELQRVRSQAKGDKQLEGRLIMELYKEKEISPFASFIPILIQLPIFFALFVVLQDVLKSGEIAKLAYEPVKQLGPIADIIQGVTPLKPTLLGLIDLAKPSVLLAALAALAQFIQSKQLQPKHVDENDPQAKMMRMMIYLFPGLTFIIGLSLPSALALYWGVTSAVAILQQYLVLHRDVEEVEEYAETHPSKSAKALKSGKTKGGKV